MSTSSTTAAVRALATRVAHGCGLVLEDVSVTPAGRRRVLRVVVDLPETSTGGVPMDAVAAASQALSEALDAGDVMGATPYVLEVSSPGVDRPLTEPRHYRRARGRLIRVSLRDGSVVEGRVAEADAEGIGFSDGRRLAWELVGTGRVEIEFSRPEEMAPEGPEADDDVRGPVGGHHAGRSGAGRGGREREA